MKITFLGTGASHGIPVIGCNCEVCSSSNAKDKRLRSSILIQTASNAIVIDAGPDFRQQMLREKISRVDAVLLTHEHKDHTAGLDDVRAFNYLMNKPMSIYAEKRVLDSIIREYSYVFSDNKYPGIPEMDLKAIDNSSFCIGDDEINPVQVYHHKLPVFAYRIGNMAYVTDAKTIPDTEKDKLKNLDVLVLNSLRKRPHISHMGIDEAIALVKELNPKQAFLTHISHKQYMYDELINILPSNMKPAYDGLKIEIS
ncbi:MAG: MBL fold metallo-hydrolase [Salinivirgaceae bacterium]|nr:MBL fold metallo-hydrolase [Salinivirgaceae bacterium]